MIITQAKSNLKFSRLTSFIEGEPEALLAIEVVADSESEYYGKAITSKLSVMLQRRAYQIGLFYDFKNW